MNILEVEEGGEEEFEEEESHHFSIEEETEELINEVFNQKYQPVYNPKSTKKREELYKKQKKLINYHHKHKEPNNSNSTIKIYQNVEEEDVSSFKQFLVRAQGRIDKRNHWLKEERAKKEENQIKTLKEIPDILRGSREKVIPIYERCINLQKSREKVLEIKRIEKYKKDVERAESFTYHPSINGPKQKMRTFEQYFAEKQAWREEKEQQLQKKRVAFEVKKLSQCTFTPTLISKYNKPNPRIIPGERVEERLLRSIERSLEKGKENQ